MMATTSENMIGSLLVVSSIGLLCGDILVTPLGEVFSCVHADLLVRPQVLETMSTPEAGYGEAMRPSEGKGVRFESRMLERHRCGTVSVIIGSRCVAVLHAAVLADGMFCSLFFFLQKSFSTGLGVTGLVSASGR